MHDSKTASIEKPLPSRRSSSMTTIHFYALVRLWRIAPLLLGYCVSAHAFSAHVQCEARSSVNRVTVLELYTSEGCNSCPPADRWLSSLPARGLTSDRLIPLAFHVDYWDQLGWPDRMAKEQFSMRQRTQSQRNGNSFVYTPQLLLNGNEYRIDTHIEQTISKLNRLPAAADLFVRQHLSSAELELEIDARLEHEYADPVQIFIAVTEDGLESSIKAGENQGKLLHHDFVVRELVRAIRGDASGDVHWRSVTMLDADWKRADLSLVVFVQNQRNGDILQALKTPLCASK
jgi:hypothetical protein